MAPIRPFTVYRKNRLPAEEASEQTGHLHLIGGSGRAAIFHHFKKSAADKKLNPMIRRAFVSAGL
ncbi:hypothetical protein OYT88_10530 [Sporolactobacillus sp. CQH2019]|uniref:hypothetical protein n=1 Tax=Sporolactobacillus sp. CQH2019 TaxID=3023512 RepID=UPI00236884D5|nr:hypothetical protein [Sporolactobacillus sp. CQH2019]MDD9148985.1 hypothetical protein [Sporolactobacillus sp. CQH2019]